MGVLHNRFRYKKVSLMRSLKIKISLKDIGNALKLYAQLCKQRLLCEWCRWERGIEKMKIQKVKLSYFKSSLLPAIFCEPRPGFRTATSHNFRVLTSLVAICFQSKNSTKVAFGLAVQRPREGSEDSNHSLFAIRFSPLTTIDQCCDVAVYGFATIENW